MHRTIFMESSEIDYEAKGVIYKAGRHMHIYNWDGSWLQATNMSFPEPAISSFAIIFPPDEVKWLESNYTENKWREEDILLFESWARKHGVTHVMLDSDSVCENEFFITLKKMLF